MNEFLSKKKKFFLIITLLLINYFPFFSEEKTVYVDSLGKLRSYSEEDEILDVSMSKNGLKSEVIMSEGRLLLKKFDKKGRLISIVRWNKEYEAIESQVDIEYFGDTAIKKSSKESNYNLETMTICSFDEKEHMIKRIIKELSDNVDTEVVLSEEQWEYDYENRVILATILKNDKNKKNEKITYTYTSKSSKPDSTFYINDKKTKTIVYSKEKDYITEVFFDNSIWVQSIYVDDVKNEEIYYNGDKVIRRKKVSK